MEPDARPGRRRYWPTERERGAVPLDTLQAAYCAAPAALSAGLYFHEHVPVTPALLDFIAAHYDANLPDSTRWLLGRACCRTAVTRGSDGPMLGFLAAVPLPLDVPGATAPGGEMAALGTLLCVVPELRGTGLVRQLLARTIALTAQLGYRARFFTVQRPVDLPVAVTVRRFVLDDVSAAEAAVPAADPTAALNLRPKPARTAAALLGDANRPPSAPARPAGLAWHHDTWGALGTGDDACLLGFVGAYGGAQACRRRAAAVVLRASAAEYHLLGLRCDAGPARVAELLHAVRRLLPLAPAPHPARPTLVVCAADAALFPAGAPPPAGLRDARGVPNYAVHLHNLLLPAGGDGGDLTPPLAVPML